jgi:sulfide:quinone oxidoreductase
MSGHAAPTSVLIAGGGVAALETMLALRVLAGEHVDVELLAAEPAFWYRPSAVAEPFGLADVRHFPLAELAAAAGATFTPGTLASVDAKRRLALTSTGMVVPFDVLVVATGAAPEPALRGAVTFRGPADCEKIDALLAEVASQEARSIAFVIPVGPSWSLLPYELALLTSDWSSARAVVELEVLVVTPEERPLAILGPHASTAIEALLARHAVRLIANTQAVAVHHRDLVLLRNGCVQADRVIAAPRLRGQAIGGLPQNADGFVPVDRHGRVTGLERVYAAGDVTTFPVKHAGMAAQQADAVAEAIAEAVGENLVARPFRPLVDEAAKAIIEPKSSSMGTIAGRYLGQFLEGPFAATAARRP